MCNVSVTTPKLSLMDRVTHAILSTMPLIKDDTDTILVQRLLEFVGADPWSAGFKMEMLDGSLSKRPASYGWFDDWDARLHADRIRYLAESPELYNPIDVDNECHGNHILPIPVVVDGHHRLFAHAWLGLETIEAQYGGRLDVLDYLKGITSELPEF